MVMKWTMLGVALDPEQTTPEVALEVIKGTAIEAALVLPQMVLVATIEAMRGVELETVHDAMNEEPSV